MDMTPPQRTNKKPMSYDAFWLRYLRAHSSPATRAMHYTGSLLALACLFLGVLVDWR